MTRRGFQHGGEDGDLFRGTAKYYARFRHPYPEEVISYLVRECGLEEGCGRLLDVGCGTGHVFQALAPYFAEVIAFDPDADMLGQAGRAIEEHGLGHVALHRIKAEEIHVGLGYFRMVAFGASFHWTERERVTELVYDRLEPGGHLVVMAAGSPYSGDAPWEVAMREVIEAWLGPQRRAGGGNFERGDLHGNVIARTRFGLPRTVDLFVDDAWTVDEMIGLLYSTSYASKAVLQDRAEGFEAQMRERLTEVADGGLLKKRVGYGVVLAQKVA